MNNKNENNRNIKKISTLKTELNNTPIKEKNKKHNSITELNNEVFFRTEKVCISILLSKLIS